MMRLRSFLLLTSFFQLLAATSVVQADPTPASKEAPFEFTAHLSYGPMGPVRSETEFYQGEIVTVRYRVRLKPKTEVSWKGICAGHILNNAKGQHEILYGAIDVRDYVNPDDNTYVGVFEVKTADLAPGNYQIDAGASDSETDTAVSIDFNFTVVPYPKPKPTKILVLKYPSQWLFSAGERTVVEVQLMANLPPEQAPRWHVAAKMINVSSGKTITIHDGSIDHLFTFTGVSSQDGRNLHHSTIDIPLRLYESGKWNIEIGIEEKNTQTSKEISFPLQVVDPFEGTEHAAE